MPKHIVLCSDGTGNTPGKGLGTNVWKTYLAVDRHDHEEQTDRPQQVAFYDDGVGTDGVRAVRLAGGACGFGLGRNIGQLYTSLVLNYEPGDKVFLFGFSRGAFTVRSLAGMICQCGLLRRDDYLRTPVQGRDRLLRRVLRAYRSDEETAGQEIREALGLREVGIEFIGVWDTVDAVGVPFDELRHVDRVWRRCFGVRLWGFYDRVLSSKVKRGCQALAIDDERRTFHPNVWEPREGVEQVWFAGVHSNIGGGYPKEELSSVALYWMLLQAQAAGLRFVPDAVRAAHDQANVHGKLYDSRRGLGAYYRYSPRDISGLSGDGPIQVHVTVLDRIRWGTDGYSPTNLPAVFEVVDPDGSRKTGVRRRIEDQQAWVGRRAAARTAERGSIRTLRRKRARLYYGFLLLNWCIAFTLAVAMFEWADAGHMLVAYSRTLGPVLGWANPAVVFIVSHGGALISGIVGVVIPGFLEKPLRAFETIPEITLLFVLCGGLLAWRRRLLSTRMRELGELVWR